VYVYKEFEILMHESLNNLTILAVGWPFDPLKIQDKNELLDLPLTKPSGISEI
jgi:hypothetical protein